MVIISTEVLSELKKVTDAAQPYEATAYLFTDKEGKIVVKVPQDILRSPGHFDDNNPERMYNWIKEYGNPTAIFHSHPFIGRRGACPSYTDIQYMIFTIACYKCIWLIMTRDYQLRAWTLEGLHPKEIKLELSDNNVKTDKI